MISSFGIILIESINQNYRNTSPRVWRRCEPGGFSINPRVSAKPGGVFSMPNPATISKAQKILNASARRPPVLRTTPSASSFNTWELGGVFLGEPSSQSVDLLV